MLKENYNCKEWKEKETYYTQILEGIIIPELPEIDDVKRLNSRLDSIMTEALFDYGYIKRKENSIHTDLKNEEISLFTTIKKTNLDAGVKLTENEVKGLVKQQLMTNEYKETKADIYSILKIFMERATFMDSVVKIIKAKRDAITVANISLATEVKASGATKGVDLQQISA